MGELKICNYPAYPAYFPDWIVLQALSECLQVLRGWERDLAEMSWKGMPQMLFCRAGDKTWDQTWRNEGRGEDMQVTYLLP